MRRGCQLRTSSTQAAICNASLSRPKGATICKPSGKPFEDQPGGRSPGGEHHPRPANPGRDGDGRQQRRAYQAAALRAQYALLGGLDVFVTPYGADTYLHTNLSSAVETGAYPSWPRD
jgi:hypothetical protein